MASLSVDDSSTRRTDSPSLGAGRGLGGTPSTGTPSLSPVPFATPTPAEARAFEEERVKLYQQIDEKVGKIGLESLATFITHTLSLSLTG